MLKKRDRREYNAQKLPIKELWRQGALRAFAMLFAICFIFTAAVAEQYIAKNTLHAHNTAGFNESCTVCANLSGALNIVKLMGSVLAPINAITCIIFSIALFITFYLLEFEVNTLVKLKIRFDN